MLAGWHTRCRRDDLRDASVMAYMRMLAGWHTRCWRDGIQDASVMAYMIPITRIPPGHEKKILEKLRDDIQDAWGMAYRMVAG